MMADDVVKLPIALGILVTKVLKEKYGIDEKWKDQSARHGRFTRDELAKIEEFDIFVPTQGDLVGIEKLPNLKRLSLNGGKRSNEYIHPDARNSIGAKDLACLEQCTNLESLSVVNQPNMTDIDLGGMPNLRCVDIRNNMNLLDIYGIDQLRHLESLTCYGNQGLETFDGLDRAIIQNKDHLSSLNMDVTLFPMVIGYQPEDGTYNQEIVNILEEKDPDRVQWRETLTSTEDIRLNHNEMLEMHNTACRILSEICPANADVRDTIIAVERYLAENVTYDDDGLANNSTSFEVLADGHKKQRGPTYGTNSAYNCLIHKTCVCEGYTRGEQYMLGLKGIRSHNVSCIIGKDTLGMGDENIQEEVPTQNTLPKGDYHSIICYDGYYNLYSDPCWNACYYEDERERVKKGEKVSVQLPYTLLSKSEIKKYHTLSFEEREFPDCGEDVTRREIKEALDSNILFSKLSKNKINEQREKLQTALGTVKGSKGQIYGTEPSIC